MEYSHERKVLNISVSMISRVQKGMIRRIKMTVDRAEQGGNIGWKAGGPDNGISGRETNGGC